MNRNNLIGWIFLVICTIAAPLHAQNSVKVKGAQGRWQVSEEITLKEAEERAFMEAKKEALRKAGVMVVRIRTDFPGERHRVSRGIFTDERTCDWGNGECYQQESRGSVGYEYP